MELYGHILTIYNSTAANLQAVKQMLNDRQFPFEMIETTFFFGTSSIAKSKDFRKDLLATSLIYTIFFLSEPSGSIIKGKDIDGGMMEHIDEIFFGG